MKAPQRHEVLGKRPPNEPCCVCGKPIRTASYHTIGAPGCRARGRMWPRGLYTHVRHRPGTYEWWVRLGRRVRGFERLFDAASDARYKRYYSNLATLANRVTDGKAEEIPAGHD